MKSLSIAILCLLLAGCQEAKREQPALLTQKDSLSYAVGLDIGRNLKRQSLDVNLDVVARGMQDLYTGSSTVLTDSVAQSFTAALRRQMMARHAEERRVQGEKNLADGQKFLAENKGKEGIVALPSGLQYRILKAGKGKRPGPNDSVIISYKASLIDGTEFDNTYKQGGAATFPVTGVIKGWTEALKLMPVGSTWQLFIPPDLAYGERGAGQTIPPNATLIYELELGSIK